MGLHLSQTEHRWDVVKQEIHIVDVQPSNLQQPSDAIMSIWTNFIHYLLSLLAAHIILHV